MMTYSKGKIVKGTVSGIESYGIFVRFDEYYSGLIHISEISSNYVRNPNFFAEIGETIYVEILSVDEKSHHLKLSIKNIAYKIGKNSKKMKIQETKNGFETLRERLPYWIEENIKNHKNKINSIDK